MTSTKRLVRTLALVVLAIAVCAAFPLTSSAAKATKHGVTSLSPKKGASIGVDRPPTLRVRVRGPGVVYFHVCKRKKLDRNGKLCNSADIDPGHKGKKTRKGRNYSFKTDKNTFPGWWTHTPGVYYWQAFRISCTPNNDCIQEGVVRGIRVK